MAKKRRIFPFEYYHAPSSDSTPLPCSEEGCDAPGVFKVTDPFYEGQPPRFLCEKHIKIHNESMDFYRDMTPEQIEHQLREDMKWRKPTWPLGVQRRRFPFLYKDSPFETDSSTKTPTVHIPNTIQDALAVLSVTFPLTMVQLKKAYKEMVKKYHPDANRHLKDAEERVKAINAAYTLLRQFLASQ